MIILVILLIGICCIFAFFYFRQKYALKRLLIDIEAKKTSETNLLLTSKTQNMEVEKVINAFNLLFEELRETKVVSWQEQETLKLALHNITHDIRTPLTVASGYTQQLLRKNTDEQEILEKIQDNIRTVSGRLDILLEYQNLLEQSVQPVFEPVNLTELVKQELLQFYDVLNEKKFAVEVDLEQAFMITNDADLLKRIMQNIFGNVLKHGRDYLQVRISETQGRIQVEVINRERQPIKNLERLTTRFYSENMSKTEDSSGLGLYIAKELAELTGGYLIIQEKEDLFMVILDWPHA
ncbi:sensor histidine kinase [Oceanobacillus neutriphilus]|uniref:histidine kinase n=1 Tax=Oceanobacillus neutriphilus TaxID=531815 RepID=A0ABQ2NV79_9BACI|nr:HAMP domain-containing sensor histidine kinase [Oceanobacillus neutriphilus]GGP11404.1 two-component sensor histidine kinase [Oceanobacillus neutriphilus]